MRRRLFTCCSTVSLVLCAASLIAWARTHRSGQFPTDALIVPVAGRCVIIASNHAGVGSFFGAQWISAWPSSGAGGWISGDQGREQVMPSFVALSPALQEQQAVLGRIGRLTVLRYDGSFLPPRLKLDSPPDFKGTAARFYMVSMPSHYPVVATALLPLLWLTQRLRRAARTRRRTAANLCVACGYDLRAGGDRCPECGLPIRAAHA